MDTPVPALVIVDAQQGLLSGETAVPHAQQIVERLSNLLNAARIAGALIIHLQNDGAAGTPDEPGTWGWHIHPSLLPNSGELLIRKTKDDGFIDTELESVLSGKGVQRVAFAGLLSEMCVSATVRGALARNLNVVLVQDAHATYDLDDIPSTIVSRVAEHALGDDVEFATISTIIFGECTTL